jgi:hypothetical protein
MMMMKVSAQPLTSTPPKAMRVSASHNEYNNNNKNKNNNKGGKKRKTRRAFRSKNVRNVVVRAKQNDKDDEDENDRRMAKLAKLEKVFLIVFNSGQANEALYTTSSREFDVPRNDFLCFASMRDALRASVLISEQTDLMPVVEGVSADVVLFLCSRSGFGAEVIGEGERWTPPGVVIEDDDALVEDMSSDSRSDGSSSSGEEELAISSADLEKYLADGGSFREEIREQFYDDDDDDDSVEGEQKETKEVTAADLEDARRIAAYAVQSAAAKPIKALSDAFERTARLSTLKSILRRNANKVSATTNGALMNALQNVARKRMMTKPKNEDF